MKKPIVVLEEWKKGVYWNRLVTDGYAIWLEYLPKYEYEKVWVRDDATPEYWLKVFSYK